MVRLIILLALLCLTVLEWRRGTHKSVYYLAITALFAFFSLRYGQGTDYLTYLSIYANVPPLSQLPAYSAFSYNKIEIGFFYLISLFRMFHLHYGIFIACIAGFSLFGIHRFIKRFCKLPIFALTFFFAVYSIVYMESAIRQMLAVSIVLGFVLPWWTSGRRLLPMLGIAAASLLHTSAVLMLVLPLLFWRPRAMFVVEWGKKRSAIVLSLLVAAAAVINFVDVSGIIALLPPQLEYTVMSYYANRQLSLMPLMNRSVFMLIVLVLGIRAKNDLSDSEKLLFNLYMVGYAVYLLLMSSDLIASRMNLYLRIVDICLIPLLFDKNRAFVRKTMVALPVMLALFSYLYVKDVRAVMANGQYYSRNPIEYPYITVFNTGDLMDKKFVNVKNAQAMNAYKAGGLSYDEYYRQLQRKPVARTTYLPY